MLIGHSKTKAADQSGYFAKSFDRVFTVRTVHMCTNVANQNVYNGVSLYHVNLGIDTIRGQTPLQISYTPDVNHKSSQTDESY